MDEMQAHTPATEPLDETAPEIAAAIDALLNQAIIDTHDCQPVSCENLIHDAVASHFFHYFTIHPFGLMTCPMIMSNSISRMEFSHDTGCTHSSCSAGTIVRPASFVALT